MSQDWKKTHLAEGEIFWGDQQAWKSERGQQKRLENIRGLRLNHAGGISLCTLWARLGSCCCHHLPGYSPLFPSQTHWHQLLQLSSIFVLVMGLLRASTELWSFPLLGGRSCFSDQGLQWHAVCQLHTRGICGAGHLPPSGEPAAASIQG